MVIKIKRLERQELNEGSSGTVKTYLVVEGEKKFIIGCRFHPHHGSGLSLAGQEGTLHLRTEDNSVVRQVVALGGGCALAISEDVIEGLSPAALRAVIMAEHTGETGEIHISSDELKNDH